MCQRRPNKAENLEGNKTIEIKFQQEMSTYILNDAHFHSMVECGTKRPVTYEAI